MNQDSQKKDICVVGGGLAGPLFAILMAQKGYKVKLFERRGDMRKVSMSAGRSINLALSVRGFRALEKVGLKDELLKICIPMIGRMIHDLEGNTTLQRYGKDDSEAIYSVSRGDLNRILLTQAESIPGVELHFHTNCNKYDVKTNTLYFNQKNEDGTTRDFTLSKHLVVSADGYSSIVRDSLCRETRMNYSQEYESHGYKELTLPAGENNSFLMDRTSLHIWPRGGFMLIALPNLEGSYTCTLFLSHEDGQENFKKLKTDEDIQKFFQQYFKDAYDMIPDLVEQFQRNPIGNLCTIKCFPWNLNDSTILIGDAAHAIVPFYGQGMNCAFEDCAVFKEMIDGLDKEDLSNDDWAQLLKDFAKSRKPNTDAIADMAAQNFVEMRDLVNDPFFKLKKACEMKIALKYPDFIPKYSLISFSTKPYSLAMKRGEAHEKVLSQMCQSIKSTEEFDEDKGYADITKIYKEHDLY